MKLQIDMKFFVSGLAALALFTFIIIRPMFSTTFSHLGYSYFDNLPISLLTVFLTYGGLIALGCYLIAQSLRKQPIERKNS